MKNLFYLVLITLVIACNKEDETVPPPQSCTAWQCNSSYYKETSGTPNGSSNTYYYVYKVKKVIGSREIEIDKLASDTAAIRAILSPFGITYDYQTTTLGSGTQNSFEESVLTAPETFEEVVFEFRHSAPTSLYKIVSRDFFCE